MRSNRFAFLAALGLGLTGSLAVADDPAEPSFPHQTPQGLSADRPSASSRDEGGKSKPSDEQEGNQERHDRAERSERNDRDGGRSDEKLPTLPDDVKSLVQKFKEEQFAFRKAQADLIAQLKSATKDQRELLRSQLQTNREKWLEDQRQMRADIRDRLKEVKSQLSQHTDQVDDAKDRLKPHRGK